MKNISRGMRSYYIHNTSTIILAASEVPTVLLAVQLYDPDIPLCMFEIV